MKCDICGKIEGVITVRAGEGRITEEIEKKARDYIQIWNNKETIWIPHLCPEDYAKAIK